MKYFLWLVLIPIASTAQIWSDVSGLQNLGGVVEKLYVQGEFLYALGQLDLGVGDGPRAAYRLDGQSMEYIGPIHDQGAFLSMDTLYGLTYFGGSQLTNFADLDNGDGIVASDGNQWYGLANGICGVISEISAIERYQGNLYVGGQLSAVDCDFDSNYLGLAKWNGENWSMVGGVFNPPVIWDMAVFQDKLYVAGNFASVSLDNTTSNSFPVNGIAWFDGETWGQPLQGVNGFIRTIELNEDKNTMYVGGSFNGAGSVECVDVAKWDGESWSAVGGNLTGDVYDLTFYQGQLYACGYSIGENNSWVAYFNGEEWIDVPGPNALVKSIQSFNDDLYIAGNFTSVDGIPAYRFAKYYLHPDSVQWSRPVTVSISDALVEDEDWSVYPNPTESKIILSRSVPYTGSLVLIDDSGKAIRQEELSGMMRFEWDLSDISSGTYLIRFNDRNGSSFQKRIVIN